MMPAVDAAGDEAQLPTLWAALLPEREYPNPTMHDRHETVLPTRLRCSRSKFSAAAARTQRLDGASDTIACHLQQRIPHTADGCAVARWFPNDTRRCVRDSQRFSISQPFTNAGLADAATMPGSQHARQLCIVNALAEVRRGVCSGKRNA